MAVTKIWPVKGRLDAVIRYAGNEEKTRLPDLTGLSAGKDDLSDVLQYAANDAKTTRESQLFVSGVNCVPEIARQQMELTKQQFGKTGGTVAFHAYQSFRPGEVTPEQCHAIGVELAKRVWGDRFQVLVATHLNTDCCHNHFVINSVSFVDGKRYNDCKKTYRALQDASDELCREQGLSVVDKKDAHRVPRNLYLAEKAGEPTRYNVMRQDIDLAILRSETPRDLPHILRKMGYEVDFNPNHKYPTMVSCVYSRSISHPPIITREIGKKICVFPQITLANSFSKVKSGSRTSGLSSHWVPYCTTGQSVTATMPTSMIWHLRSFPHSPLRMLPMMYTSSAALPFIDQSDQGQKEHRLCNDNQKRLGCCHKIGADPFQ